MNLKNEQSIAPFSAQEIATQHPGLPPPMAKTKAVKEAKEEPIEKQPISLRKNIDAAEYKHVVLGLMFLKYISDSFEEMYARLQKGEGEYTGADPEDKDEYKAENIFFVPPVARWSQSKKNIPCLPLAALWSCW